MSLLLIGVKQTLVTLSSLIDVYPNSCGASGPLVDPLMFLSGAVLSVASLKTAMQKRLWAPNNTAYQPEPTFTAQREREEEGGKEQR